jgi:hypothetical protein
MVNPRFELTPAARENQLRVHSPLLADLAERFRTIFLYVSFSENRPEKLQGKEEDFH